MAGAGIRCSGSRYQQYIPIGFSPDLLYCTAASVQESPGSVRALQLMVQVPVKVVYSVFGRITVLILWRRKGHR